MDVQLIINAAADVARLALIIPAAVLAGAMTVALLSIVARLIAHK